jgi:membrane-associated phospholipid phosphatase
MNTSRTAAVLGMALLLAPHSAWAADQPSSPVLRAQSWLITSYDEIKSSAPPADAAAELKELRALVDKRTSADIDRIHWWHLPGAVYRWNEIAVREMLDGFVTLPLAARHLALVHAAMDDAVAAAWHYKRISARARPNMADPSIRTAILAPTTPSYPSETAAAAVAAAQVLAHLFPRRAEAFAALAEETMRTALLAGIEYPSDAAAGRVLGNQVAALAIARSKNDGADGKWSGSIPEGAGRWRGDNPIAPAAATWRPWVLASHDEFRPKPPPAVNSEQIKRDLEELRSYQRTPRSNHHAIYWEVFGGVRAHLLWNDIARMKLLEYGSAFDPPAAARALATLNVAFTDAAIACWDAKYAYWYIRPSQLDANLKPLFPPPNHPSYPAAHGCLSTAAATVLASIFPRDSERLLALGKEAGDARIWAGIHYRTDVEAGQELGRNVAEKVLKRAYVNELR